MRASRPSLLALSALLLAGSLGGCGEEEPERREWRPEDHVQPQQPDPERSAGADPGAAEAPSPEVVARAAAALFRARCASCHGADGAGGGPQAPAGADMPDLTSAEYQESRSDDEIARAITMGRGMMPAFGSQINQRGVAALVGHVRALRETP
ncbi:MAG TPA: cytochrome c [Sandaracinaceae bacterium LLY-WYZ-13_1]|nr:cytochrome c [Sandaracinaceae bacterium LLY-WYZ-13_1]